MFEREGNGGWRKEGQVGVTSPGALSSGSCQKAAENSKGVAEEFHEGIICKGMSGLKGQRVGIRSQDRSCGLQERAKGMELLLSHQSTFCREVTWLRLGF